MTVEAHAENQTTKITGSIWHYADSWLVRLKTDNFREFSLKIDNHMSNANMIGFWGSLRDWFNSDFKITSADEVREVGCLYNETGFEITTNGHMQYAMPVAFEIFEWATGMIGKHTLDQITNHGQSMPHQYITAEKIDGQLKAYVCKDGVKLSSVSNHEVMDLIQQDNDTIIYPSPAISELETQVMWGGDAGNRTKYLGSVGSRKPWIKAWYWCNILKANADNSDFGWSADGIECDSADNDMPAQ